MTDTNDTPSTPAASPRASRGLRRPGTIAASVGLLVGGIAGGLVISQAATGTASPSPSGQGAAATAPTSNENSQHEAGESAQHEADETAGRFHGGPGGPGGARGEDAQVVAGALGISAAQLQTDLAASGTIAAVAKAHNVDVAKVVSALVASENKEIDDRVTAGRLTAAQATQAKTMTQQRVTDLVNGVHTEHGGHGGFSPAGGLPGA